MFKIIEIVDNEKSEKKEQSKQGDKSQLNIIVDDSS